MECRFVLQVQTRNDCFSAYLNLIVYRTVRYPSNVFKQQAGYRVHRVDKIPSKDYLESIQMEFS